MHFATLTILKNCYCSLLCIDLIGVYNIVIKLNIVQFHSYFMKLKYILVSSSTAVGCGKIKTRGNYSMFSLKLYIFLNI